MTTNRTFIYPEQEHTLGVLLRNRLLDNPEVVFAAYKVPHPMIRSVEVRVQTMPTTSTEIVVKQAIDEINANLDDFEVAFNKVIN